MPMAVEASERLLSEGKSAVDVVVQDAAQQKGVIGQLLRLRRLCGLHWCHLASWNGLKTLALGQLLAILLTTTGVTSSLLAQRGMSSHVVIFVDHVLGRRHHAFRFFDFSRKFL